MSVRTIELLYYFCLQLLQDLFLELSQRRDGILGRVVAADLDLDLLAFSLKYRLILLVFEYGDLQFDAYIVGVLFRDVATLRRFDVL